MNIRLILIFFLAIFLLVLSIYSMKDPALTLLGIDSHQIPISKAENSQKNFNKRPPVELINEEKNKNSTETTATNSDELDNPSDWMISMESPSTSVHEIVANYRKKSSHSNLDKEKLIKGLSYCSNRRSVGDVVAEQRSHGSGAEANRLLEVHYEYMKYCNSLDEASFLLRRDVLEELADGGSSDAKRMYFEAGPLGRWPSENEYLPLTQKEIEDWNRTAIQYLEQTIKEGDFRSYKTLATMYSANPTDPILGRLYDTSLAYAYDSLWVASIISNPNTTEEIKNSLSIYLNNIESKISPEEKNEGLAHAAKILIRMKK